jgi:glycosyltransferase involved in cell wall biosynthesis
MLFRHVYGLYIGSRNKRFFQCYGIPDHKLFWTPYTVDNAFFQTQANELIEQKAALRKSYGIRRNVPVILFCGKLIPKKDPLSLVKAFALVRRTTGCALLFAGDGPLRGDITDLVRREVIPDVHIAGFLNQSQISQAYAMADMLVLPSTCRETWGLVINEAMNFGLPIVVSDKVGCAGDLVLHGQNGYVVPAGSIGALGQSLKALVTDPNRRRVFGERSRHIVDGWGIEHTADGIVSAALATARRRPRGEHTHLPSRVLEPQEANQEEVRESG